MKAAGVSYAVCREGVKQFGESLAGRQDLLPGRHQFRFLIDANADGGLLPWIVPQERVASTRRRRWQISVVLFPALLD